MYFHLPLKDVEQVPIKDYRLMLFTVFNSAVLHSGYGDFKYQTDSEASDELEEQIKYYKSKGFFNG